MKRLQKLKGVGLFENCLAWLLASPLCVSGQWGRAIHLPTSAVERVRLLRMERSAPHEKRC